jgi:hypothetical protein
MRHTRYGNGSVLLNQNQEMLMKMFYRIDGNLLPICLLALFTTGCSLEEVIIFSGDVKPILDQHCIECHQTGGSGVEASGFSMETYEGLMRGTNGGPMIVAGDAEGSNMLVLMEGRADPSISMPHGYREPASTQNLQTIRLWIDQGAKNN